MKKAEKSLDKKENLVVRTLKFKVRPQGYNFLNLAAIEINSIWNYCNEVSFKAIKPYFGPPKYLSGFDLNKLLAGCTKSKQNPGFSNILADCVQLTAQEYAIRRNQFKKSKLRFRKSFGTNKSLGWIPLKRLSFQLKYGQKLKNGGIIFKGKSFPLYNFEYLRFNLDILKGKLKQGSFSQDKLGDWYFNVVCEIPRENFEAWLFDLNKNSNQNLSLKSLIPGRKNPWNQIGVEEVIGLDPGVSSLATDSLGTVYEAFRGYRKAQEKLAKAQSLGDKQKVKFLSKKVKNSRRDSLHKISIQILNSAQTIKIGKVQLKDWIGKKENNFTNEVKTLKIDIKNLVENPNFYVKKFNDENLNNEIKTQTSPSTSTKSKTLGHGKAVLDSGLGMLKTFLFYKGKFAGRKVVEVCEKYSTQICSNCFELSGPKGEKELKIRQWTCSGCGMHHQRDQNAAINIARVLEGLTLLESIEIFKKELTQPRGLKVIGARCRPLEKNLKGNIKQKDLVSREMGKTFTA